MYQVCEEPSFRLDHRSGKKTVSQIQKECPGGVSFNGPVKPDEAGDNIQTNLCVIQMMYDTKTSECVLQWL